MVCAESPFTKVTFDRLVMTLFLLNFQFLLYLLCSWIIEIVKECMSKGTNSQCSYIHNLYFIPS